MNHSTTAKKKKKKLSPRKLRAWICHKSLIGPTIVGWKEITCQSNLRTCVFSSIKSCRKTKTWCHNDDTLEFHYMEEQVLLCLCTSPLAKNELLLSTPTYWSECSPRDVRMQFLFCFMIFFLFFFYGCMGLHCIDLNLSGMNCI